MLTARQSVFAKASPDTARRSCTTVLQAEVNDADGMKWRGIAEKSHKKLQAFDICFITFLQFCNINSKTG